GGGWWPEGAVGCAWRGGVTRGSEAIHPGCPARSERRGPGFPPAPAKRERASHWLPPTRRCATGNYLARRHTLPDGPPQFATGRQATPPQASAAWQCSRKAWPARSSRETRLRPQYPLVPQLLIITEYK